MPRPTRVDDFAFFANGGRPLAMAHRGGALTDGNIGIENSMAAFSSAVALGFDYVETDVHATSDGVVLAFHDRTLDRVTDRTGHVAALPYAEVRRARIGGREPVPTLGELLDAWPELKVNVDCKSRNAIRPLADLIAERRAWDRVCVASFSPWRLSRLRSRLGTRVATAYSPLGIAGLRFLPGRAARRTAVSAPGVAAQVPVAAAGLPIVTAGFVARAHELGKHVHVWTVDDAGAMHRLLDLGVDGIITDRLDVLRDVFQARDIWPAAS